MRATSEQLLNKYREQDEDRHYRPINNGNNGNGPLNRRNNSRNYRPNLRSSSPPQKSLYKSRNTNEIPDGNLPFNRDRSKPHDLFVIDNIGDRRLPIMKQPAIKEIVSEDTAKKINLTEDTIDENISNNSNILKTDALPEKVTESTTLADETKTTNGNNEGGNPRLMAQMSNLLNILQQVCFFIIHNSLIFCCNSRDHLLPINLL